VKTSSEERVAESACDDKFGQEIKKYLGSAPLLYEENQKDYNQITRLVIEQLRPTNILEEIWVKDLHLLVLGGATFKSLQTKAVLYSCGG
jgi:hypothetical protein